MNTVFYRKYGSFVLLYDFTNREWHELNITSSYLFEKIFIKKLTYNKIINMYSNYFRVNKLLAKRDYQDFRNLIYEKLGDFILYPKYDYLKNE